MHDAQEDAQGNKYFPAEMFKGYHARKVNFMLAAVKAGCKSKTVFISHINLLMAGWLIKKYSPSTNVMIMAHGIEVWKPLSSIKKNMLMACDKIISVSHFTSGTVQALHGLPLHKCAVLNNCIDPYLPPFEGTEKNEVLMNRYGFKASDKILFTLTRLSKRDRYKGYDYVLEAMVKLIRFNKNIKYLLAGKYDSAEKLHLDNIIAQFGLTENVILTGFVADEELPAHFSLADIYVMPSVKEGFGIVFIEAMYYGIPVIAGNEDGSVDALLQGRLGLLIQPNAPEAITKAITKMITEKEKFIPDHKMLMQYFGYEAYKDKLYGVLDTNNEE